MEMDSKSTRLKRLREMAGLSQYELAKLSGIARNRLSLAECGYVELRDEEYGLAEHTLRDALIERQQHLRTALSGGWPPRLDPTFAQKQMPPALESRTALKGKPNASI